jgi:hypothetical protein
VSGRLGRLARAALIALAIGAGAAGPGRAAEPDPFRLLVFGLLELDSTELFPPGEGGPLAEMQAQGALYGALRDAARGDGTPDLRRLKLFLLAGWTARVKNDFATIESFDTDLRALLEAEPDKVLRGLAEADFMLPELCTGLGKSFFFGDARPEERAPFLARHRAQLETALGPDRTARCIAAIEAVTR